MSKNALSLNAEKKEEKFILDPNQSKNQINSLVLLTWIHCIHTF